ncbi:hypothetical protein PENTCL1PPCAC_914, partial [Pristionchus entomophagus]
FCVANRIIRQNANSQTMRSDILVASCLTLVSVLAVFNLIGISGILPPIKVHYNLNDSQTAIIQTASSIAHTVTLALIWLFGDMFTRRRLFLSSAAIWIILSLLSVFLGSNSFTIFVSLRALASAASAAFEVLVPALMADTFRDRALGIALMCVTFSGQVAIFAALIVSSWIVTSGVPWQSGLIAYPLLAIAPLLCILCAGNGVIHEDQPERSLKRSFSGAFGILSIRTFVFLTAAGSCSNFFLTAYNFWFPSMYLVVWTNMPNLFFGLAFPTINSINTAVIIAGMVCGLPIIVPLAQSWRLGTGLFTGRKEFMRAYPVVVSAGTLLTSVMFITTILLLDRSYIACLIVTFFTGFGMVGEATLAQQMLLMVVPSNFRASSIALNNLIIGLVAIPSAQLVGMLADILRGDSTLPYDQFHAYQWANLCFTFFTVAAALCFVFVVVFFPEDCRKAEDNVEDNERISLIEKSAL